MMVATTSVFQLTKKNRDIAITATQELGATGNGDALAIEFFSSIRRLLL
jgi:hypothetical protein